MLKRVRENSTKFIKSITINQVSGYDEKMGIWFKDISIPLNPGLVAIIGNKGAGKSAVLDIIGLCGNSHQYEEFSFLEEKRFKKDSLAKNFNACLEWENGEKILKNLDDKTDKTVPERVRYLPQNYFERLTNNLDAYEFEKTLEKVVFAFLPEEQKLGKNSFEELIKSKKEMIDRDIDEFFKEIKKLNEKIIELEKKEHPDYKKELENKLKLKKTELEEHDKIRPKEIEKLEEKSEITEDLERLKKENENIERKIKEKKQENILISQEIEELNKIKRELENFKKQIDKYSSENEEKLKKYGFNIKDLIQLTVNTKLIKNDINLKTKQMEKNSEDIEKVNKKKREIDEKIREIKDNLSDRQRSYQKYLEELKNWEERRNKIIGDENSLDTIKWLEKELKYINEELRIELESLREKRISRSLEIFNKKMELINIYKNFKDYVDKEIFSYKNVLGEYEINIEATLKLIEEFYDKFISFINQKVRGSFYGIDEGKRVLLKLTRKFDLSSKDDIKQFLREIIDYLECDKREKFQGERRYIPDQVSDRGINEFYNYVFSLEYIQPVYQLKLGDKNLTQLSPGEKGALLIVFYLMLDKDNIPLLIDQPEENLDNESIYKILTHFIRLTKKKRQIVIVTHNPNLAIVGDAEQIIFVNIDKRNKNKLALKLVLLRIRKLINTLLIF